MAFLADCPDETRAPILARLQRMRALDDRRVAREWLRQYEGKRARGDDWFRSALSERGVEADVIAEVLAELPPEHVRMRQALTGAARSPTATARFLASRGFDPETILAETILAEAIPAEIESDATLSDDAP
ncbi:MAG: RecX family transcriptional regulator [Fimbriimonadaceae bacterium]|nr:RecX family transcriptional regulator [Fimbriimonadaceae bacterium]